MPTLLVIYVYCFQYLPGPVAEEIHGGHRPHVRLQLVHMVARLRVLNGDPAGAYTPLARAIALNESLRSKAGQEKVFEALRQGDPRMQALLRLR